MWRQLLYRTINLSAELQSDTQPFKPTSAGELCGIPSTNLRLYSIQMFASFPPSPAYDY